MTPLPIIVNALNSDVKIRIKTSTVPNGERLGLLPIK